VKDLADVAENIKKKIEIRPVSTLDEVLEVALADPIVSIEWDEDEEMAKSVPAQEDEDGAVVTH